MSVVRAYPYGVTVTVSGHELTQSHDCATVGCDQEAAVQLGSLWYCRTHAGPIPKDAAQTSSANGSTVADRRALARRLREEGHTHRAIAERLDVSTSTVSNYLNGTGKPTGGVLSASGPSVKGSGHQETPANGETVRGSFEFRARRAGRAGPPARCGASRLRARPPGARGGGQALGRSGRQTRER